MIASPKDRLTSKDMAINALCGALDMGIENSKFDVIILPSGVIGPYALISIGASKADLELAGKLVLTYARTKKGQIYEINLGDKTLNLEPFESKAVASKFFVG